MKVLRAAMHRERPSQDPVGVNAPVDLSGRTPLGRQNRSKKELSPLPSQKMRELLFAPGDKSVLPIQPYQNRTGISPVKVKSPFPPSASAATLLPPGTIPSPVPYNKCSAVEEAGEGEGAEAETAAPSEEPSPEVNPTQWHTGAVAGPRAPIPATPQYATQQRPSIDIYASSAAGGWKSYMEDRILVPVSYAQDKPFVHKGWNIYAVCDGHGGVYCSQYLVDQFPHVLARIAERENLLGMHCPDSTPDRLREILMEVFATIEQELAANPRMEVEVKSVHGMTHDPATGQVCAM